MKFSKGETVFFRRNAAVCTDNTPVCAINKEQGFYVVENNYGWTPDPIRAKQYGLNEKKKYLFVHENELKTIAERKKEVAELKAQQEEIEIEREQELQKQQAQQKKASKAKPAKTKKKKKR